MLGGVSLWNIWHASLSNWTHICALCLSLLICLPLWPTLENICLTHALSLSPFLPFSLLLHGCYIFTNPHPYFICSAYTERHSRSIFMHKHTTILHVAETRARNDRQAYAVHTASIVMVAISCSSPHHTVSSTPPVFLMICPVYVMVSARCRSGRQAFIHSTAHQRESTTVTPLYLWVCTYEWCIREFLCFCIYMHCVCIL